METSVVMHFFNEELLIGDWIDHHKQFFDNAILINHQSTDGSADIARAKLPNGWKIVDTRLKDFNAHANDAEVMDYEKQLPGWKMALNTTEFLFCPDLKQKIEQWQEQYKDVRAFGSRCVCLVDKEEQPIEQPIWKNRTWGFLNYGPGNPVIRYWRFIHNAEHGNYVVGRHITQLPNKEIEDFYHLHFLFSPWPQAMQRKLQIQTRIPASDKSARLGYQHIVDAAGLEARRAEYLGLSYDLFSLPLFKKYYEELEKK